MGAWLGGWVFEATGNYNWIWYADIVLALGAALIHMPIREARVSQIKKGLILRPALKGSLNLKVSKGPEETTCRN